MERLTWHEWQLNGETSSGLLGEVLTRTSRRKTQTGPAGEATSRLR